MIKYAIIFCSIQYLLAACPDTNLYCYGSNGENYGMITVNQCWFWSRLSCQPCNVKISGRKFDYGFYLPQCKSFSSETVLVLTSKTISAHNFRIIKSEISFG